MCLLPSPLFVSSSSCGLPRLAKPRETIASPAKGPRVTKREKDGKSNAAISIHFLLWLWPHLVSMIDGDRSVSVNQ